MKVLIFLFIIGMMSCTRVVYNGDAFQYSIFPEYLELDSIKAIHEDDTSDVIDSSYNDFKSLPLDSGVFYSIHGDTSNLPPGVLISDRKAALYIFYKSSWERYQKEVKYISMLNREYYDKAVAAEVLYQKEIARLSKEAERTWIEDNMGSIGFVAGMMVVILNVMALNGVQ